MQTKPELLLSITIHTLKKKTFLFLPLVPVLFVLVACQKAEAPTTTRSDSPSLTVTNTLEIFEPNSSEQSPPQPTGQTEQMTKEETQDSITLPPRPSPTRTVSPLARPSATKQSNQIPPSPSPPTQGGEVVIGGLSHPGTLNPILAESETDRALVPLLFDGLSSYDPHTGQLVPGLAEEWLIAPDSRSITFTLRTDAHWHDGQPVVADDVVYSFETARDPAIDSLYGPQLKHVAEVKAIDDKTVVINLDVPHCPSISVMGTLPILPHHVLAGPEPDGASVADTPLGSGPFVLVDWTAEGEVRLARNDDYWGDVPHLDTLAYRPFESIEDLKRALETEQIDVALMPAGYIPDTIEPSGTLSVYRYPAPELVFVVFNNDHPVLSDSRVRQALSMAVNREQLLDQALNSTGELVAGSLPAAHWAADPTLVPPRYDPEGARQLLAEAGWSDSDGDGWLDRDGDGLRLPVRTNGGNLLRENVAILIAGYYRAIGVDANLELVVWGAVVDDLFTHDFDTMVFSWPLKAEPDQSEWWLSSENEIGSGYNFGSFTNETVDRLLGEALAVPGCDPSDRAELYQQVQRLLAQERPYDFLVIPYATLLARPELGGIEAGPFAGPLESAAGWYLTR